MRRLGLALALAIAATGCVGGPGQPKPATGASRKPIALPAGKASPAPVAPLAGGLVAKAKLPEGLTTRVVEQGGPHATLTGKVKLISDHGAGLISNNGGGLVANNGGGIVANNGGTIIANNGGTIIANNGGAFKLKQAGEEASLVDATVFVADAAGRALVDQAGNPLAAVSDGQGGYELQAALPAENLVLKVRLWNGGELAAILPKAEAEQREVAIDTAATLGATYVLGQFVKGDQATFDKLPASEVTRLQRELAAARGLIGKVPDYTADALVALTDELRAKAPAVDKSLTDIKALLLGQANLGAGRNALEVPLTDPRSLARLPDGALLLGEALIGRIRRIAPDGTVGTLLDGLQGEKARTNWYGMNDLRVAPDGTIYGVDGGTLRVRKLAPDGTEAVVAGTGQAGPGAVGPRATETALSPWALELAPDGTLYVGENKVPGREPRVFAIAPDGAIRELPKGPDWAERGLVTLALGADGTLWALTRDPGTLYSLPKGGQAWTKAADGFVLSKEGSMRLAPDGRPVVAECDGHRVTRVEADGTKTVLAGAGGPPGTAELAQPGGLLFEPGGRLLISDYGANAIWGLGADQRLVRVAGQAKASQAGADGSIAVNTPGGLGFDSKGRMIVSDGGSHTLRRFDGKGLETIAGGSMGFAGDGGPAAGGRFDGPAGLEVQDDVVWVCDTGNHRLRRVGADGVITTAAGADVEPRRLEPAKPVAPGAYAVARGMDVAIAPDGLPAWSDVYLNQVARPRADGQVELLAGVGGDAGGYGGDGGTPEAAELDTPLGVAYGPDGSLFIADAGNMRIRRVSPDRKTIETFCGQDKIQTLMGLAGDTLGGTTRETAFMVLPGGLCVDAAGNVYVGELGTASLPLLAGFTKGFEGLPVDQLPKTPARVRKIAKDGTVSVVAGPGGKFFADPTAGDALLLPSGLAIDPQGRLVIMDAGANLIRFLPAGSF